jgi:XTP/dITP diphosphohydrolase
VRIVLATRNRGKLEEVRRALLGSPLEVECMEDAGVDPALELQEPEATFEGNALSKARQLQERLSGWALADDSGLEVDALGGAPGVRSARYAGAPTGRAGSSDRDRANTAKLLAALAGVPATRRTARFVCALALLGPTGACWQVRGACEGRILEAPRGHGGFGYDPVFLPEGFDRSMAELDLEEKNRISHRGRALAELLHRLESVTLDRGR